MEEAGRQYRLILTTVFFIVTFGKKVDCWWWSVAQDSVHHSLQNNESICDEIEGFTNYQRRWCNRKDEFMILISEGARKGISECKYQFRNNRWNCPTVNDSSIFGKLAERDTREMAFAHAITAAGAVHSIARACERDQLPDRRCPHAIIPSDKGEMVFGENSAYAPFASDMVKYFLKGGKRRKAKSRRDIMNIHNNLVGRMAVVTTSKTMCKCHGFKSSCEIKTCWKQVRDFRVIGDYLKESYARAHQVRVSKKRNLISRWLDAAPSNKDLAYFDSSPDYCYQDSDWGIAGTVGRECNVTSFGPEGCDLLCCGRGYKSESIRTNEPCTGSSGSIEACTHVIYRNVCK